MIGGIIDISLQASGGRHLAPADPNYPFRAVVLEQHETRGWRRLAIFECATEAEANDLGMDMCTEPYEAGIVAMHFYVGEVGNG